MSIKELHGRWSGLVLEQNVHVEEVARLAVEKRQLFLQWLADNPLYLSQLRGGTSQRAIAYYVGTNFTYVCWFEKGEISRISDEALNKLFSYYMRLEDDARRTAAARDADIRQESSVQHEP